MACVDVRVLGALRVRVDGQCVALTGRRAPALLALLAAQVGEVVGVDTVLAEIWGASAGGRPVNAVQARVSALRRLLGPDVVRGCGGGYLLDIPPEAVDTVRFDHLVAQGLAARGTPDVAAAALGQALALWRGEPYADLVDHPFVRAERARLTELRMTALHERIQADLARGRHERLVPELTELTAAHPGVEAFWVQRMLALYRCGRQAESLRVYHEARGTLREKFGLDPGPELREIESAVLNQSDRLGAHGAGTGGEAPTAVRVADRPSGRPVSSFVGRDEELPRLRSLLAASRLVTLTGPGGTGKTRLAVETMRALATADDPACTDGAYILDLAAYRPGDDLSRAALTALHLATGSAYRPPDGGPARRTLITALTGRRVLLVLDNCEHLLDDVAALADALLTGTDGTVLLATSREVLGVPGETVLSVPSLSVPPDGDQRQHDPDAALRFAAVRLFADRARAADPGFELSAGVSGDVAGICRRLDGLPLAIELAAARVRALTPSQIKVRLADRFRLLASGTRTTPRHRTLLAAVDWSHELLDEGTREAFAYLSVFHGRFDLVAAEELGARLGIEPAEMADRVVRLVDKSLVQAVPGDAGAMRYRMLETLREYAADRLADRGRAEDAAAHHAELYVELAERQAPALRGTGQARAIRVLEAEDDDLRGAFDHCCRTGRHEPALRLVAALGWYLWMRGDRAFGRRGVLRALRVDPEEQDRLRRARALTWSCHLGALGAIEPEGRAHGRQARAILERLHLTREPEYALCNLVGAFACYRDNDHAEGDAWIGRALRLSGELGDPWLLGCATVVAGIGHVLRGEFGEAEPRLRESIRHYRRADDAWGEHRSLIWLSRTYEDTGELPRAERAGGQALTLVRGLGLGEAAAPLLGWLARLRLLRGDVPAATATLAELHRIRWWQSSTEAAAWVAQCDALLAERRGLRVQAARLHAAAARCLDAAGMRVHAVQSRCRQVVLRAAAARPDHAALATAARIAAAQPGPQALALVLDTLAVVEPDERTAAEHLALADTVGERAGLARSPLFTADVARRRPFLPDVPARTPPDTPEAAARSVLASLSGVRTPD